MRKVRKFKKEQTKELLYLGERISETRNTSGLTQQDLAEQCHRGVRHIQNIEGGLANPSYEVLSDLVHRLGMSANILFFPDMPQIGAELQYSSSEIACRFRICAASEQAESDILGQFHRIPGSLSTVQPE